MTSHDLASVVRDIEPLRACLIVEARSGALHEAFRREGVPADPEAVARAVAGLARAQTDVVELSEAPQLTTLEWPDVTVVVRSVSAAALVVFFFEPSVSLGMLRMHVTNVVDAVAPLLPTVGAPTARAMPAVPRAPSEASSSSEGSIASRRAGKLLAYLDAEAPDTHAALLRVSLQTGLPLSVLETPERLSDDEFAQVTASVRRILGVEQLPF